MSSDEDAVRSLQANRPLYYETDEKIFCTSIAFCFFFELRLMTNNNGDDVENGNKFIKAKKFRPWKTDCLAIYLHYVYKTRESHGHIMDFEGKVGRRLFTGLPLSFGGQKTKKKVSEGEDSERQRYTPGRLVFFLDT